MVRSTSNHTRLVAWRRSLTLALVSATLLLSACGGGSADSGDTGSRLNNRSPLSETPSNADGTSPDSTGSRDKISGGSSSDDAPESDLSENSGVPNTEQPTEQISQPSPGKDAVLKPEPVPVLDAVELAWNQPRFRENGDDLNPGEIGGYEIRYRQVGEGEPESVVLDGYWHLSYELSDLEQGDYEFTIAAYDVNGLYSEFVPLTPQ